ncbi:MAG: hypothetical protein KAX55_17505 [Propionivibrio sp.]|jgi:hypothetical protein|nr:hypothetical protein [Propionivibrio sp.]MBP8868203.1 hypothetical protein [Propionivibrio sp.]
MMNSLCAKHRLPTAPLASRLINQRAAAPWITLPLRRFRDSVTAVSQMRDRDFAESVTV